MRISLHGGDGVRSKMQVSVSVGRYVRFEVRFVREEGTGEARIRSVTAACRWKLPVPPARQQCTAKTVFTRTPVRSWGSRSGAGRGPLIGHTRSSHSDTFLPISFYSLARYATYFLSMSR